MSHFKTPDRQASQIYCNILGLRHSEVFLAQKDSLGEFGNDVCLPLIVGRTGLLSSKNHHPPSFHLASFLFIHSVSSWALEQFRFRKGNQDLERPHWVWGHLQGCQVLLSCSLGLAIALLMPL